MIIKVFFSLQLLLSLILDLLFGDPKWLPHPIKYIGWICSNSERLIRRAFFPFSLRVKGVLVFFITIFSVLSTLWILFYFFSLLGPEISICASVILLYLSIAAGDLFNHSNAVYIELQKQDLNGARHAVSMIVGRDTEAMTSTDICRGCIESVTENLVDGITAPVFWSVCSAVAALIFGFDPLLFAVFGAYSYKSVNTMDSMFGYKNKRYLEFGWFPAKADDVFNYLPARISGLCVVLGALLLGMDYKTSLKVFLRDRYNSSSPNSGHTESAAAGALNIQLGGTSSYFGTITQKPLIGAGLKLPDVDDIIFTNKLVFTTTLVFTGICILFYNFILFLNL